jgi:hypothetical protein
MKTCLLSFVLLLLMASCNKLQNKNNDCPVVAASSVPAAVKKSFTEKYPNSTVEKWYSKDNTSYTALFNLNGSKVLSQFDQEGAIQKEELQEKEEYANESKNEDDQGCDCEPEGDEK